MLLTFHPPPTSPTRRSVTDSYFTRQIRDKKTDTVNNISTENDCFFNLDLGGHACKKIKNAQNAKYFAPRQ